MTNYKLQCINVGGGKMTIVSSKVFAEDPNHYLKLSKKEEVAIKSGKTMYYILPKPPKAKNNIDPSDPFWDDPRNVEEVERAIDRYKSGEMKFTTLSREEQRKILGL